MVLWALRAAASLLVLLLLSYLLLLLLLLFDLSHQFALGLLLLGYL